jgi:hypothetical protein
MSACFSYTVLAGSIVVVEVGVVLVHITEARLAGWVPGARQCCVYFCISGQYHCLSIYKLNLADQAKAALHLTVFSV